MTGITPPPRPSDLPEPVNLDAFYPDAARAAFLNRRMAGQLAQSIGELVRALREKMTFDERPILGACEAIEESGAADSGVYATYFDLLADVRTGNGEHALQSVARLQALPLQALPFRVVRWGDRDFAPKAALFYRQLTRDPSNSIRVDELPPADFERGRAVADQAMLILDRAAPELFAEIRELVRELVLVRPASDQHVPFGGATSLYCWGAMFLNVERYGSLVEMIDALAHESAHAHLFGLSLGAPFVLNPLEQRFSSPLRADGRPLDGIFHAAFVSARMHYVHARLIDSGLLSPEDQGAAEASRHSARQAFCAGLATLQAHASLTPLGERVMANASDYIGGC